MSKLSKKKFKICMVCDFFYPNMGGVETHIWSLSQCLIEKGHKVIIVTHSYNGRQGVRLMTNGIKVYYLKLNIVYDQIILPTFCSFYSLFRYILLSEKINIVHGHQSTSVMTNECLLFANSLNIKTCYTDHSLFNFNEIGSIHINKLLQITMSNIEHIICVSNICKENFILRTKIYPSNISTIPNAVDSLKFKPDPTKRMNNTINIIVLSRLVYRKGIDLLVKVIPIVCAKTNNVNFIIGGDGPKLILLEEMKEKYQLHNRIELLGGIPHNKVRDLLIRGNIFLNCSLTESFCIALLEAASCGLFLVSTKVGGVTEVLPNSMIKFSEPNAASLADAVIESIYLTRRCDPMEIHERIKGMYNWFDVAKRTIKVYDSIHNKKKNKSSLNRRKKDSELLNRTSRLGYDSDHSACSNSSSDSDFDSSENNLATRLHRSYSAGPFSGILACFLIVFLYFLNLYNEFVCPSHTIEKAPDTIFLNKYTKNKSKVKKSLKK